MKKIISLIICMCLLAGLTISCKSCKKKNNSNELVYVHSWTAEGLGGHFYSGANMGPVSWYVVEGLGDYLRTQDYVYYTTAKSIEHDTNHTSIVTLRDDVYWQGSNNKFTSMDVVGFYYLNTSTLASYLTKIEAVNDTQIKFYWNENVEPADDVKTLLLVTDRVACVPYSEFQPFVDVCMNIYNTSPTREDSTITSMVPFNREVSSDDSIMLSETYGKYQAFKPKYFPATGPYQIDSYDANEMILTRNENWYAKDKVGFDTIRCINSVGDASLFANMIISGDIDLWLNTPSKPTIDNILKQNDDVVFYKVLSPYTHGVKFNFQKETLWTAKVREAFEYIFDRDEVRKLACYYANTSYTSMTGMTDTDCKKWMSSACYQEYEQKYVYSYDLNKAESLLKQAGWSRKSGKWVDQNGKLVELVIGYDGSNTIPSTVAETIQAQLTNFGIQSSLKRASSYAEFYAMATQANSAYDLVCDNTSYNASYSYPSSCFQEMYKSGVGATANIKSFMTQNLVGYQSEIYQPGQYIDNMLTYSNDELIHAVDNLVTGAAKMNFGINMFQEASGGIYNTAKIGGLPYFEKTKENRDVQYIPSDGSADHIQMLYAILFYDHGSALYNGTLYPANRNK
jgi:ABC-type oligopeptide transport system substrate-binding subunit